MNTAATTVNLIKTKEKENTPGIAKHRRKGRGREYKRKDIDKTKNK